MAKCNIELYGKGLCGKPAIWKHPRWPTGAYCTEHKEKLEEFFPDNWVLLDGTEKGIVTEKEFLAEQLEFINRMNNNQKFSGFLKGGWK